MLSTNSSCRSGLARATTIALILCLLSTSAPAAPQTIVALAKESSISFGFWFRASGLPKLIQGQGNARRQEKQSDRDARVSRLQIFPGDLTVQLDQQVRFSAIAYSADGSPVSGVKIKWSVQDEGRKKVGLISPQGEFRAFSPGKVKIIAEGAGQRAQADIVVPNGQRLPRSTDTPTSIRPVSNRKPPSTTGDNRSNSPQEAGSQQSARKVSDVRTLSKSRKKTTFAHTRSTTGVSMPLLPDAGWNDSNFASSSDPRNDVGNPPGAPMDGGAGSGNFQFAAPILGLPGRGISISLGAAYNSRLWNKSGSEITYDIDRSWPAPGFSLGFGKLLGMGVYNGGMLVDADGTRHSYAGTVSPYGPYSHFLGHTTDGSFVDYWYTTGVGGGIVNAEARLPNGTAITYGAPGPGAVYPTSIEDENGNYITITYVGNAGPRIQTITDTLGRAILFYYDSNNLLTAITTPGYESGTRELARFHYHQLSLNYGFSGLTPAVRDSNPWVIDAIYYPATSTGYYFGDSDSYSSYGMLAKVVEQRGMGFSASSLTDMGSVSQGQTTRTESYNYPLNPDYGLTDAPTYTSMTESWSRDGTNFDSASTTYEVHENSTPRTVTITLPNGTKSTQYSFNNPGNYNDGLVYYDETRDSANTLLQSSSSTWVQGAYDAPRPTRVEKTDERGQITATEFSYGTAYNQVTEVRDFDYGGTTLLSATRTLYQNSDNYTGHTTTFDYQGRHIFNLPTKVEVYAGDNSTRLSQTDYQYDGQTLTQRADVVHHDFAFDPYASDEGLCYWENDWSDPDCSGGCPPDVMGCDGYCPQIYYCPYNSSTDYRGNVTQATSYADASNLTGAVTETRRYDITGNLVTASTACCEQTSFGYTVNTQYAYPESKTRGSATDPYSQVTTRATYDFNTGLTRSATDANGRQSQTSYDSNTLRPAISTSPTGAHTDLAYDDEDMTVTSTTYLASGEGGGIADQTVKFLNGQGQVRQEKALGVSSTWDVVDTIYNNLGQVYQQSRPYRLGAESPVFSTATYDALGRALTVTAPDGSVTQTFYNEASRPDAASSTPGETTRVQDAWGRERWGRTDASGRLVEVVEPNPTGNGSVATSGLVTTYAYNTLGNLTTINQGAQTRSFAYDSLGRLTAQKLAETSATLNSAGTYVGSGTWSDVFTYDNRSNLTSRTDARGVKTVYSYGSDPLNRLQSVSWDTSGFGDAANPILAAATVSYSYRTKGSPTDPKDVTQLLSVSASGVSTEAYDYDGEGRAYMHTVTLNSRSSYPFVTDYSYDSLDRVTDVHYPAEYGNGSAPRKAVHHNYDIASRLTGLTYDGQSFASSIVYNAASQTTSLNAGSGTNQIAESYSYNAQTGLLDNQTVTRGATTLLNLSYDYAGANGKRTGQLTKILNNLNHNKDRGYSYDALGRLVQATGGPSASPLSTQTYSYDRYGNRLSVSASGYSAKNGKADSADVSSTLSAQNQRGSSPTVREGSSSIAPPSNPKLALPTDLLARNNSGEFVPGSNPTVKQGSAALSDSSTSLYNPSRTKASTAAPTDPPTFTNSPLTAGIEVKAIHITELRDAINALRARLGMSAYSWTTSATTNDWITAGPVLEMRTALDQALGAPSGGYAAGLAQGQPILAIHIQELRDRVVAAWTASSQIPRDGLASVSYDTATNRITTSGFAYDAVGNQVRALAQGGGSQRFKYDAANRLVQVKADDNTTIRATYTYGDSNKRLISEEGDFRTYYVSEGGAAIAEYTESGASIIPAWSKSYVYLGARLMSTLTPNGSGGEAVEYHHPDRLGTRLVSNPSNGTSYEQVTLPFGTALSAESTGATNRRFTSYDRSATTGLDYAINRHYDPQQGRFTQVDPAGMGATNLESPQTLNLYAYCANDPINYTDPSGLGFFSFLKRLFGKVVHAFKAAVVAFVTAFVTGGNFRTARRDAIRAFVSDLGFSTRTWNTPQWNPNAHPIIGGGIGPLSRYIIVNFQAQDPVPDVITFWILESASSKIAALMRRIKQALCRAVPSGRTSGVQLSMGAKAGPTGGVELVQNFRTGQTSGFAFGGGQVGVVGGLSGQVNSGFIWGRLEDDNSNYSGPFAGASGSYGTFGGFVQSGSGLTVIGASAGVSMTSFTATGGITKYTKPLQLGRWWYQALNDNAIDRPLILANQVCR